MSHRLAPILLALDRATFPARAFCLLCSRMQFQRTLMLDIDLTEPLPASWAAAGYAEALVLVRWRTMPLTTVSVRCDGSVLTADAVRTALVAHSGIVAAIGAQGVREWLLGAAASEPTTSLPSWSVVVCTRDRADDLHRCLGALLALEPPPGAPRGEIVVVDNAPSDDGAARVVAAYQQQPPPAADPARPALRYVREDRPGLNWARACGARAATGEVVAYTDDDVVVDPWWVARMLAPFADSRVGAVTGLTMPLEIETEAQWLFERYGGFARGFGRRVFDPDQFPASGIGAAGAGANVAFRRALVVGRGLFDVELDAGTVTLTGGDTYALYLVMRAGLQVVYTPAAVVWHRHRREYGPLRRTLYGYSVGGFAYLTRCLVEHGDLGAVRTAVQWLWGDHVRLLGRVVRRKPSALPRDLVLAYCQGVFVGPWRYLQSRRIERRYRRVDAAGRSGGATSDAATGVVAPRLREAEP